MPGDNWTKPRKRRPNWQSFGACRNTDVEKYIPKKESSKDTKRYDKTVCKGCIVKDDCLNYALANRIRLGLWGGTTPEERKKQRMYTRYKGEREYECTLDYYLFPSKRRDGSVPAENDNVETDGDTIFSPVADNNYVYPAWVQKLFIQNPIYDE